MKIQFPNSVDIFLAAVSSVIIPMGLLASYTFMSAPDGPYSPPWPSAFYSHYLWLVLPITAILLIKPFLKIFRKGGPLAIVIASMTVIISLVFFLFLKA